MDFQMAQLVCNNILNTMKRGLDEIEIEEDIARFGAASPAFCYASDRNFTLS